MNWTAPQQCLDQYAGMQECQFGEVGYAIMKTSDPKTSVSLIYGTATGGCKDPLNYYAIVGQTPKPLTAQACTSLNTKVRSARCNDSGVWLFKNHRFLLAPLFASL